jgi:hypothetical protein
MAEGILCSCVVLHSIPRSNSVYYPPTEKCKPRYFNKLSITAKNVQNTYLSCQKLNKKLETLKPAIGAGPNSMTVI